MDTYSMHQTMDQTPGPAFYQTTPTIRTTVKHHPDEHSNNNNNPPHHHHHHHQHHHHHGQNLHDTNGQVYEADERNLREYKDRIRLINLNYVLRKYLLLPIPQKYCSALWCVKDGLGFTGCVFTWLLIVFGETVFTLFVLIPFHNSTWSALNGVFTITCAFLGFVAHVKAMFTDPGAVPRGNATKENIAKLGLKDGQVVYKCPKCVSIKPERAHHCSVCRRCIRKMDHHCPWVNNCVGENNQKYFILFTFYICTISIHALYMSIHHFVVCIKDDWKLCTAYSPAATTIFLIFLLFESLLFGIFTAIMCGTQLSAVCSDETGIESLKNEQGTWEKKSWWWSLKAVFGHPFSYKWFSPFHSANMGKKEYRPKIRDVEEC